MKVVCVGGGWSVKDNFTCYSAYCKCNGYVLGLWLKLVQNKRRCSYNFAIELFLILHDKESWKFMYALPVYSLYSSRPRNPGSWLQRDSVNVWNLIIISGISELTGCVKERTLGPQNWILCPVPSLPFYLLSSSSKSSITKLKPIMTIPRQSSWNQCWVLSNTSMIPGRKETFCWTNEQMKWIQSGWKSDLIFRKLLNVFCQRGPVHWQCN